MAIQTIEGSEGMSIYDACLIAYAGFDNLVKFLKDNGIENMNDMSVAGMSLIYDTNLNQSTSLNSVVIKNKLTFATLVEQDYTRITEDGYLRETEESYTRLL